MKKLHRVIVPMQFKADAAPDARTFEGITAVWDKDLGGDVIHKGAFKDTINTWKNSEDALPLLNSHNQFDIFSGIGQLTDAKEQKDGLWSKWEVIPGDEGDRVMTRLKPSDTTGRPIVGKMSIGFNPQEFSFEQPEGTTSWFDRIRHITKIDWKESSLVLFPMAPDARIDASTVKSIMLELKQINADGMTPELREGLRRLAGRIGVLLQKKGEEIPTHIKNLSASEGDEDLDDTDDVPPTPDITDVEDPDGDDVDDAEDTKTQIDPDEVKEYQFSEALQHRLTRLKLNRRITEVKPK